MHKDELLQLHSLLCQVKRFFQEADLTNSSRFEDYDALEVSPQHIHKSKTDHKRAVFMLGKGLSDLVMQEDPEQMARLKERFDRMAAGGHPTVPNEQTEPTRTPQAQAETSPENLPAFALAALSR